MQIIKILEKIKIRNNHIKDFEYKKSNIYSGYCSLLLSREIFKYNKDLRTFITPILEEINKTQRKNIVFKDYIYKSRSLIIARFIRIIEKSNESEFKILEQSYVNFISTLSDSDEHKASKNSNKKKENSVDELLARFPRK